MSWKWLSRSVCQALLEPGRLARHRREQLGVVQRPLGAAARALGPRLARVGAAVVLEVELAHDLRPVRLRQLAEERLGVADRRARHALQIRDPRQRLEHLRRRPAAAVAPAEHQQRSRRPLVVLEVARRPAQLGHGRLGVVGVGGREVRDHRGAVDADPAERVVVGRRVAVPGQLLGQEAADAGAAHELRELAVVAEHVGVPEHLGAAPEFLLEEALAVEELADQRLARGQVAVGLDPRPADRQPLAARDGVLDARVEPRRTVADPRVLLRLRAREAVVRIGLHQPQLARERAHALAVGLLERPQPGGVDVRVADRGDLVHPRAVAPSEQRREDLPVARVAEAVELAQQLAAPRALLLVHQRRQHAEIGRELPRVRIEARDLAALEPERRRDRLRPLRRRVQLRPAEQPVAGDLHLRGDPAVGRDERGARCGPGPRRSPAPATGSPSTHTVASEFVTKRRSTREPAHASGTSAETSSHHVAHSGPSSIPSSASRSTPSGPVIRSREHARVSG